MCLFWVGRGGGDRRTVSLDANKSPWVRYSVDVATAGGSAPPYGLKIFAADSQPQTAPEELHGEREASRRKYSDKLHAPGVVSAISTPRIPCTSEPDGHGVGCILHLIGTIQNGPHHSHLVPIHAIMWCWGLSLMFPSTHIVVTCRRFYGA